MKEIRISAKLRKVSDVPVGVFLSGGVDSSTNAVVFAENSKNSVETFSVGYDKNYIGCSNEFVFARKIAEQIHANHHEIIMDEEKTLAFLENMVKLQGEPLADPVCVPVYYLSKLARDNGVIVCQVGEGADELFAGYSFWHSMQKCINLDKKICCGNIFKRIASNIVGCVKGRYGWHYELIQRSIMNKPLYWSNAESFFEESKKAILSKEFYEKYSNYTSYATIRETYERFCEKKKQVGSILDWMTYSELNLRLPELLLQRIDKMSMGASVECRVPFLDHKLVEMAMSIPDNLKIHNGESKYILKKVAEELLPFEIIYRKKQGFDLPVDKWFRSYLGEKMKISIQSFIQQTGYINNKVIEEKWNTNLLYGNRRNWILYNLAMWWENCIA